MHPQENTQVVMETTLLALGPLLRWTGVSFQPPCIPVWHQPQATTQTLLEALMKNSAGIRGNY